MTQDTIGGRGITLADALHEVPKCPSMSTLKRWSRDGILNVAKLPTSTKRRMVYDAAKLASIVEERGGSREKRVIATANPESASALKDQLKELLQEVVREELEKLLREVTASIDGAVEKRLSRAEAEISNLDATRKMLMVNTDGHLAQLKQRLMDAQNRTRDVDQLSMQIERLSARVNDLANALRD